MHLVIPVTIATAMAADVMRQRCFSVRRGPRRQIGGIGLNIRTHASPNVRQDQVSGGLSVKCSIETSRKSVKSQIR